MPGTGEQLLRTIAAALERRGTVNRSDVVEYGRALGLPPEEIDATAARLLEEKLIDVSWAGAVVVTEAGRARLRGPIGSIHIDTGGGDLIAPGAAFGHGAHGGFQAAGDAIMGRGSQGRQGPDVSELVLALAELRRLRAGAALPSEAHAPVAELEAAVQEVVTAVAHSPSAEAAATTIAKTQPVAVAPEPKWLEARLDRAKGLLERVSGISEAAAKLGPALALLGPALAGAAAWVSHLVR